MYLYLLRRILADSIWTAALRHRIGKLPAATCPHCCRCEETLEHMWWECPAWESQRAAHAEANEAFSDAWPVCLKRCGICPQGCSAPVAPVQRMMVAILEARHAAELVAAPARFVGGQRLRTARQSTRMALPSPASSVTALPSVAVHASSTTTLPSVLANRVSNGRGARRARGRAAPAAAE